MPGTLEVASFYPLDAPDAKNLVLSNEAFALQYPGSSAKLWYMQDYDLTAQDQRLRAGTPPEVLYAAFGPNKESYDRVQAGQLMNLDPALGTPLDGYGGTWRDNILPALNRYLTNPTDAGTYAVPRELTVVQMFYNKALFARLGIAVPTTWDQFLAASATLKSAGVAPIAVTGKYALSMQYWYEYLLLRAGGAEAAQDAANGKGSFADVPNAKLAADKLKQLLDNGYFLDGFQGTDVLPSQIAFFSGKAGMILMGSWLVAEMKDSIPADFELGTFAFPSLGIPTGNDTDLFGNVNSLSVAAQAKRPDLGVAWLRVFSSPAVQLGRANTLGYISGYKGVPGPAGYEGIVDKLQTATDLRTLGFGIGPSSPTELQEAYPQQVVRLFFGDATPDEMVAAADAKLKAYWQKQPH